jgi:hypothetical protein
MSLQEEYHELLQELCLISSDGALIDPEFDGWAASPKLIAAMWRMATAMRLKGLGNDNIRAFFYCPSPYLNRQRPLALLTVEVEGAPCGHEDLVFEAAMAWCHSETPTEFLKEHPNVPE